MKKIILVGASGMVGSAILKESLERGHDVTAIVRHPEKITLNYPNLQIMRGDVLLEESVPELIRGADAVISAYNPGWTNPNIAEETTKAYQSIVKAVKKEKIPRLLIVGGAGSLFVAPGKRVVDTGVIPDSYLPAVEALAGVYYNLQKEEKELDWVFFSPAGNIEPGERTGKFRLGKDDLIVDNDGNSNISAEDYAVAMLDELEKPQHHKERFTIGY
ncbi:MAG: NAD(P)-dependent oxidoreductase [Paludibacter sp.]|nr:NAD(P)-dependent oxidoreductase [Paludibacter sp.]